MSTQDQKGVCKPGGPELVSRIFEVRQKDFENENLNVNCQKVFENQSESKRFSNSDLSFAKRVL